MIDVAAELVAALRSPSGRDALREALAPVVAEEVRRALEQRAERLEPLAQILQISIKAASARLARDPQLRAVGIQVGRRTLFRRSSIESYFAARSLAR